MGGQRQAGLTAARRHGRAAGRDALQSAAAPAPAATVPALADETCGRGLQSGSHARPPLATRALPCAQTSRPAPGGTGWMSRYKWFQTAFGFKMLFIFCSNYENNTLSEQITENTKIPQGKRGSPRLPPPGEPGWCPRRRPVRGGRDPSSAPHAHPTPEPPPEPRGCRRGHPLSAQRGLSTEGRNAQPSSPGTPASGP